MKKLLTLLFLVAVFCPVFAENIFDENNMMEEISSQIKKEAELNISDIIISTPATVEKKYVTKELPYPTGAYVQEGKKMTSNSYNMVSVLVPANDSIINNLHCAYDNARIYFNQDSNTIAVKSKDDEYDKLFIELDYEISFYDEEEQKRWQAADPDFRSVEEIKGKVLQITIKYAPKYFTFVDIKNDDREKVKKYDNISLTYPIFTFKNKGNTTDIYLVPTDNLRQDFDNAK